MPLSLDSNVLIDIGNGDDPSVRRSFQQARRRDEVMHVSPQALHEVTYGALISARPLQQSELLERVLVGVVRAEFTADDALASAQVRAGRRRLGKPMAPIDAMIAGQALSRGWTVVTADPDDFDNIPGLSVVDWRAAGSSLDL